MENVGLFTVSLSLAFGLVYGDFGDKPLSSGSEVYISLMVSSAPTSNTLEVISAVDRTVENFNSDPYILPTFSLQYGTTDTQVWSDKSYIYLAGYYNDYS